jgi:hypothetical protein
MTHKPTFKPSPARRPLHRRLTPLAWTLFGAGALLGVLLLGAALVSCTARPDGEPWEPTPTVTVAPSATPLLPTPTPAAWWEGLVSPTPPPDPAFPVWWADRMTLDQGHRIPPQEVQDAVWEAFVGGLSCWEILDREAPPQAPLEEHLREATRFLADDPAVWRAACSLDSLEDILAQRPALVLVEFGPRNPVLCDESPTRCVSAVVTHARGMLIFDPQACRDLGDAPCFSRPPLFTSESPHKLYTATLEYDEGDGRWRITQLDVTPLAE